MLSRTNPTSRASRGSSPRLAFDVRPCRRAQVLWTLFGFSATVALYFSLLRSSEWSDSLFPLISAGVALAVAWLPGQAVLRVRGPLAVRRAEWAADGAWRLLGPDGHSETGRLSRGTATLGPWILLAWTVDSGAGSPRRLFSRRYALIGAGQVGLEAFRALKGRLALPGSRHSGHTGQVPGSVAP